jgi:microcystin-dependent protein
MTNPYVGEIRMFGGNFPPSGWMLCQGQILAISEWETLFNLIGTTYGGDGTATFALPDLRGRVPVHLGNNGTTNYAMGDKGGVETVTLTTNQIPIHNHPFLVSTDGGGAISPQDSVIGSGTNVKLFRPQPAVAPLDSSAIGPSGGNQPHENLQPYLVLNYIISMFGIFPSQT